MPRNPTELPTFAPENQGDELLGNPLDPARVDTFMTDIARGGQRLAQKVTADINEISIRRAMQIGYMLACQDNNIPVPEMDDPAEEMGYGNV